MEEFSVLELINKFNFYIPEIQREFVWGKNARNILTSFCQDIILGKAQTYNENILQQKIETLTAEKRFGDIARLLEEEKNTSSLNIGFLYSYEPNYKMEHFPDSDIYSDTYLIDGQQRFTSLFLMLFYLSIKEKRQNEFIDLFRYDYEHSTIAFDYRVRTLTHDFIIKLLNEIKTEDDFDNITNRIWYLDEYVKDVTITSMVNGLSIIRKEFKNQQNTFFDFILQHIKFWHFKTEKTSQGEELYITMNSRGKQLEENETVRAKLFEQIDNSEQLKWSKEWEEWQDFFWKERRKNNNADVGFNEFLNCIAGMESYLGNKKEFVEDADQIYDSHILSNISLEIIDNYFSSFQCLLNNRELFVNNYEYAGWVDKAIKEFQNLILENKTNWFVDYTDDNKATERRRIVFVWSVLHYINKIGKDNVDIDDLFRLLRIYWLRYNNLDRSVVNVKDRIDEVILKGLWSQTSTKEEMLKHAFYTSKAKDKDIRKFESRIWKIEDHRFNINGYQVENINSIHLIDYKNLSNIEILDSIYNKFTSLFPVSQRDVDYNIRINDVLMFYGFYGNRRSPYYYFNYDFSSWRRIIRDLDSEDFAFKIFFNEYDGTNLDQLLEKKKLLFLKSMQKLITNAEKRIECNNLVDTIRLYILICPNIWKSGRYLAYEEWVTPQKSLTTFEKNQDRNIANKTLYNTKGNFRGYGFSILNNLLPAKPIEKLKQLL
ncbi:MAG: DUF262 domain-containing protein [Flavobacterium lindanitolerans]|uniref:DUF262 domain-containing protein n=1 Tax=Flavobacterium lindanitolerans TaxID=428988 RepID=UPI001A5A3EA2|nr:DUF262 domain-containing protein [Flavobacterium lindanitolerans]MBL7869736.1 DUF262 domain-containing protein [Flavobacterium lindanitolerans]